MLAAIVFAGAPQVRGVPSSPLEGEEARASLPRAKKLVPARPYRAYYADVRIARGRLPEGRPKRRDAGSGFQGGECLRRAWTQGRRPLGNWR